MKTEFEYLVILDERKKHLGRDLDEKRYKVVYDHESYSEVLAKDYKFKGAIILVELAWVVKINGYDINGYDIADQLLFDSFNPRNIDILFISYFSREELYVMYDTKKSRVCVKKLQHKTIEDKNFKLDDNLPDHWSDRKFNYIRKYYFQDGGILEMLLHGVQGLAASFSEEKLSRCVEEFEPYRDSLPGEIISNVDNLNKLPDKEKHDAILLLKKSLETELHSLSDVNNNPTKSKHKVMLIEDDDKTRSRLVEQFSHYYENIKGICSGSEAYQELLDNGINYDVVITDMALLEPGKDGLMFDDVKIGIDILELCEEKYKHIVTRVISGLPKNSLKNLLNKNMDHVIYKSESPNYVIPPWEGLDDFVKKINAEVKSRKNLRGKYPKLYGSLLEYLTGLDADIRKKLFDKSKEKANAFLKGDLNNLLEEEKVSTVFGRSVREDKNWELIILHRLIVLGYSKGEEFLFCNKDADGNTIEGFVIHDGFRKEEKEDGMSKKSPKRHLNTDLGFSFNSAKDQREKCLCKVKLDYLLDEEKTWLYSHNEDVFDHTRLRDIDDEFLEIYKAIMDLIHDDSNHTKDDIAISAAKKEAMNISQELLAPGKLKDVRERFDTWRSDIDMVYEDLHPSLKDVWDIIKSKIGVE